MTGDYAAYVAALRDVEDVERRATAAERAAADARRTEVADLERALAGGRERLARVAAQAEAARGQLDQLPVAVPSVQPRPSPSSSDPAALASQLVERALTLVRSGREDVDAIARERARLAQVRADLDAQRRRDGEARRTALAQAQVEAARGDRTAGRVLAGTAVAALAAGAIAPSGSAAAVALVLALVVLAAVRSRLTSAGARVQARRTGREQDDPRASTPLDGAASAAVLGLALAVTGAAAAVGGLAGGQTLNTLLGGGLLVIGLLLAVSTTRRKAGTT